MVRSLRQGEPVRLTAATLRQRTIIARFEEFLEVRRGQPVYLLDICKAVGVSERTLRAACQEQFGLSPTRYLWLRRMYLARRRLTNAEARPASVTEVAMANGFWELGRFAAEYRSLFGETPSMTLRRAS
jgi:AraC-like DNA-binding protein